MADIEEATPTPKAPAAPESAAPAAAEPLPEVASVAAPAAVPVAFTPWAFSDEGFRASMLKHLETLQPDGNPDLDQLALARAVALADIAALAPEVNFVKVNIDAHSRPLARQLNVLVVGRQVI